jgi:hypothetical protein
VRLDDTKMNLMMSQAGKVLNIKPHVVGSGKNRVVIHSCCDIEGHRIETTDSKDGSPRVRWYVLDTARVFCCEALSKDPKQNERGRVLARLLRPEFVANNAVPLSSDAFVGFGRIGAAAHNREVRAATHNLFARIVPKFATQLDDGQIDMSLVAVSVRSLNMLMRVDGINARHLGRVRRLCRVVASRRILLTAMTSRVLKHLVRSELRALLIAFSAVAAAANQQQQGNSREPQQQQQQQTTTTTKQRMASWKQRFQDGD